MPWNRDGTVLMVMAWHPRVLAVFSANADRAAQTPGTEKTEERVTGRAFAENKARHDKIASPWRKIVAHELIQRTLPPVSWVHAREPNVQSVW